MTTLNKTTWARTSLLCFIHRTTWPGYAGTTTNLQIVLNTPKNPHLNQATQKNTCQISLPKKIPESKISNPKKSFDHPRHLKSGVPPPPPHLGFCRISILTIALFTVTSSHLHYNVLERGCEAISGNFVVSARNCLTSMFKYIVMQMRKVNCEKGYSIIKFSFEIIL